MKRVASAILAVVLLIISTGSSSAYAAKMVSRGQYATGLLVNVQYSSEGSGEALVISAKNYVDYSVMELTDPQRIVLDIFNVAAPGKQQIINADGKVVKRIRYAQFDPYTARVVLEVKSETEYGTEKTETGLVLYIGEKPTDKQEEVVIPSGEATIPTVLTPSAITATPQTTPTKSTAAVTPPVMAAVSGTAQQNITVHSKFKIQYTAVENGEEVAFLLSNYQKYKVTRLTGPNRLLITIPNAQYTEVKKQVNINGSQLKSISYAKSGSAGVSITLNLNAQSQYSIAEAKGKLLLMIQPPVFRNITYYNNGDRVYFTLKDAVLTEGDEFLNSLYAGAYDDSGRQYTVSFSTGQTDFGSGVMGIGDSYLQSVEVRTNPEDGITRMTFNGTGKNSYFAYTRNSPGITTITVLKPAAQNQKLVVIDAGHGGIASGAIYRSLMEKDLNLDIAKRLNTLLEKKGVKTYMLREDDSDIANYERAYIANNLNAKLYLSIHNNAMDDKSYRGTMTLYCPTSINSNFTGRTFANIIHQKMLGSLKTVDRKVIERPDLIVLKATSMPAVLAEVAFMTNSTDRSNLQKSTFRQKAAQALCDSVIKALAKVK